MRYVHSFFMRMLMSTFDVFFAVRHDFENKCFGGCDEAEVESKTGVLGPGAKVLG